MSVELEGRAAVITGASQGLGLAIARAYVAAGARVMLAARSEADLERARAEVAALAGVGDRVRARVADVSNPADVSALVDDALGAFGRIHILVNNAAVLGPLGAVDEVSWTDWVRALEINIHGSVLPLRALLPHFRRHRYGKVIQLSGGGATAPVPRVTAYAASKAAIVRLAESVAMDVKGEGIDINSLSPGHLKTRMMDALRAAGPGTVGAEAYERIEQAARAGDPHCGPAAALAVFLGSAASDGITGKLISAPWDPWEHLAEHRADLDASDIYTLRRIVPRDRGRTWGDR